MGMGFLRHNKQAITLRLVLLFLLFFFIVFFFFMYLNPQKIADLI